MKKEIIKVAESSQSTTSRPKILAKTGKLWVVNGLLSIKNTNQPIIKYRKIRAKQK